MCYFANERCMEAEWKFSDGHNENHEIQRFPSHNIYGGLICNIHGLRLCSTSLNYSFNIDDLVHYHITSDHIHSPDWH